MKRNDAGLKPIAEIVPDLPVDQFTLQRGKKALNKIDADWHGQSGRGNASQVPPFLYRLRDRDRNPEPKRGRTISVSLRETACAKRKAKRVKVCRSII